MNNEYFQGFLTMRTSSTLIQALCVFSILFVGLVLTKRPPCEAGRRRYSEGKGRCVRCRCPKGTQLSGSEVGQPYSYLTCIFRNSRQNLNEFKNNPGLKLFLKIVLILFKIIKLKKVSPIAKLELYLL